VSQVTFVSETDVYALARWHASAGGLTATFFPCLSPRERGRLAPAPARMRADAESSPETFAEFAGLAELRTCGRPGPAGARAT